LPPTLHPETNLTAIKCKLFADSWIPLRYLHHFTLTTDDWRTDFNNSYRHMGQMAQWTGLMVYEGVDNQPGTAGNPY